MPWPTAFLGVRTASTSHALTAAIRASTMSFYAKVHHDAAVLVPILLALFEVYAGSSPALSILQLRGPAACSSGASHPL